MEELIRDYRAWSAEHHDFLAELEEHDASVFDRLYPVIKVLDHIVQGIAAKKMTSGSELEHIIQIGFEFLNDQIQTCQLYLDTMFQGDLHLFLDYEVIINYLLYIEDIRYEIAEKEYDLDVAGFDRLQEELETILETKAEIPDTLGIYVDDRVKALAADAYQEFYGIIDIFMDVADTLEIDLYESEEYVVGKDLGE
jgi:hypothetical protein